MITVCAMLAFRGQKEPDRTSAATRTRYLRRPPVRPLPENCGTHQTGNPLAGARIVREANRDGVVAQAVGDQQGRCRLDPASTRLFCGEQGKQVEKPALQLPGEVGCLRCRKGGRK